MVTPLAKKIRQVSIKLPSTYNYLLCDNLLIAPIFEENGQTEVFFPRGSNWIYYFNTDRVFSGGSKGFFTFNVDETALFMRTNSVIVFQDQIKVIAVEPGQNIKKTFIYGDYSD